MYVSHITSEQKLARNKYFAYNHFWARWWKKEKAKEAVRNSHISYDDYKNTFGENYRSPRTIKKKQIPKYIRNYSVDELFLMIYMLNKKIEDARKTLVYNKYLDVVYKHEHLLNNMFDELCLRKVPKYSEMSAEHLNNKMTLKQFIRKCASGDYTNSYGVGFYATEDFVTDVPAYPSSILSGHYREDFEYVCWKDMSFSSISIPPVYSLTRTGSYNF